MWISTKIETKHEAYDIDKTFVRCEWWSQIACKSSPSLTNEKHLIGSIVGTVGNVISRVVRTVVPVRL